MADDVLDIFWRSIPAEKLREVLEETKRVVISKDQVRRFRISIFIMDQLLKEGPNLIGENKEEHMSEWNLCVNSVFELWEASACLWEFGKYASANALAISTLEETGKLVVERMRLLGPVPHLTDEEITELQEEWSLRKKPFLDHFTKSVLASMCGSLINARLDRIVGLDFFIKFLAFAEEGKLDAMRQNCSYLDGKDGSLRRPQDAVTPEMASRFVALAGEV